MYAAFQSDSDFVFPHLGLAVHVQMDTTNRSWSEIAPIAKAIAQPIGFHGFPAWVRQDVISPLRKSSVKNSEFLD
jgi:hypothetical protein